MPIGPFDSFDEKKECCGCCVCSLICPVNAIIMIYDREGFVYPKINSSKCVNCNLCVSKCPIINRKEKNKIK